jgi:hypothetical protein
LTILVELSVATERLFQVNNAHKTHKSHSRAQSLHVREQLDAVVFDLYALQERAYFLVRGVLVEVFHLYNAINGRSRSGRGR